MTPEYIRKEMLETETLSWNNSMDSLVSLIWSYIFYNVDIFFLVFWNLLESSLGSLSSSSSSPWSAVAACPAVYVPREGPAEGLFTAPPIRPPRPQWRLANIRLPIPSNRLEWCLHLLQYFGSAAESKYNIVTQTLLQILRFSFQFFSENTK